MCRVPVVQVGRWYPGWFFGQYGGGACKPWPCCLAVLVRALFLSVPLCNLDYTFFFLGDASARCAGSISISRPRYAERGCSKHALQERSPSRRTRSGACSHQIACDGGKVQATKGAEGLHTLAVSLLKIMHLPLLYDRWEGVQVMPALPKVQHHLPVFCRHVRQHLLLESNA